VKPNFDAMYSPQLLDHFEHPRNSGELPNADARVRIENPACGDILELAIKMDAGHIAAIRFRAKGCVPAMACASALTQLANGKSVQDAAAINKHDIAGAVGGLPAASGHAAQLAVDSLQAALKKLG
jgi:nitrogen fixation NifU-like protein